METLIVSPAELRFGHEDADDLNMRRTGRAEGISELKASIAAHGIIQPLAVMPADENGLYSVIDGNRRLAAIRSLEDDGEMIEVPIVVRNPEHITDARELSLAANIMRLPLHPVDQYEAFAALEAEGLDEADIAQRFSIPPRQVKQALALGRLAPKIRDAWRKGEIDAKVARVFTLTADHKAQTRVFDKERKSGYIHAYHVREQLVGDQRGAEEAIALVGKAAYEAAGGTVMVDLFDDRHAVSDPALAIRLAQEKLEAECARLVEDGWAWAEIDRDLPHDRWSWGRARSKGKPTDEEAARLKVITARMNAIQEQDEDGAHDALNDEFNALEEEAAGIKDAIELRGFTPRQKAVSGCIVSIVGGGRIEIEYGRIKPDKKKAKANQRGDDDQDEEGAPQPTISSALMHRLSCQLTEAAADAVAIDATLALDLIIAAVSRSYCRPARIRIEGLRARPLLTDENDTFDERLARVREWSPELKHEAIGRIAAAALDFQSTNGSAPMADEEIAAIVNLIDPLAMAAALSTRFDAEDYFKTVSKDIARAAYAEMTGKTLMASAKKAEVAEMAAARAKESGWLPPELRTVHYDGPGALYDAAADQAAE